MLFKRLADADAEAREGLDESPDAADPDAAVLELPSRGRRLVADDKLSAQQNSLPIASVIKTQNPSWVVQ